MATGIPGFSSLRCSILALNREETGDLRLKAIVGCMEVLQAYCGGVGELGIRN